MYQNGLNHQMSFLFFILAISSFIMNISLVLSFDLSKEASFFVSLSSIHGCQNQYKIIFFNLAF